MPERFFDGGQQKVHRVLLGNIPTADGFDSSDVRKLGVVDLSSNSTSYRKNVSIEIGEAISVASYWYPNCIVFSPRGCFYPASDLMSKASSKSPLSTKSPEKMES